MEGEDEPWYFSLNNRRLWVLKQLREEGLLKDDKVKVRWRQPKSKAETERYTVANCSLHGSFVREKLPTESQKEEAGVCEDTVHPPAAAFARTRCTHQQRCREEAVPNHQCVVPPVFEHESYTQNVEWDHRGSLAAAKRMYEGFWDEQRSPTAAAAVWEGREDWVRLLLKLEDRCRARCLTDGWDSNSLFAGEEPKIQFIRTHGSAECRVCGADNGTGTYYWPARPTAANANAETEVVMWPEGYVHYILEHEQLPSRAFYDLVLKVSEEEEEEWPPGTAAALTEHGVAVGQARRLELGCLVAQVEGLRV